MRICSSFWGALVIVGILVVHGAAGPAAAQASRRGYSSRGVNAVGTRSAVRGRSIIGSARPAYNSRYGSNVSGPLGFNYIPNLGGYYIDPSAAFNFSNDPSMQGELGGQGDNTSQGDGASTGSRPNVRPRLNIADQDAISSIGVLTNIRREIVTQVAACAQKPFTPQWYAAHADVSPLELTAGDPWQRTDWAATGQLVGISSDPYRYDFRPDDFGLIYVFRDETRRERAVDRRRRAIELTQTAGSMTDESDGVSLGVFAAVPPVDEPVKTLLCIAINKSGKVTGYQYEFSTDSVKVLQGAVDPASQLVAWQIGNDFFEAGLKNLTEDVARSLLFRADGWTQPWILMRIPEE